MRVSELEEWEFRVVRPDAVPMDRRSTMQSVSFPNAFQAPSPYG
jgi:hypothetical protein